MSIALVFASSSVFAQDKVLSVVTLKTGGVTVGLPKTKTEEGLICQSYVSDVKRERDGAMTLKVSKFCGKPVVSQDSFGNEQIYPAGLLSVQDVTVDGIVVQMLITKSDSME
ncbi:hypothetical protein [Undibacterium oligocarboniphilum]|uniref:Uncharacterized protein n=1 Tax=Undibacterium oligocarboniphilum TaxID=666702 RepID=A0A850QP22_9BURK|nr:hypothetical protein [Undibacterium oligocarboniphilum]MBC3871789.1 hypothetical protein [Undibacterium oligocarboniphilum]NVO79425.1 hypothetical protein [Undibacterium oligocarboniphilum]